MGQPNPIKMGAPDTYGRAEEQSGLQLAWLKGAQIGDEFRHFAGFRAVQAARESM